MLTMTIEETRRYNCQCVKPDDWKPGTNRPWHTCEMSVAERPKINQSRTVKRQADNPDRRPDGGNRYKNVPTEFICVDGEGITLPDGTHRYVLLGVGDQQITNPEGLSWHECFEFLWSQFRTGSVAYVGFFLGYDFIQWFRSMPQERAKMLLTAEGRARRAPKQSKERKQPFPVRMGEWEFDILGNKRFKLRKAGSKRWMNICDTGPFFQKSFLKVIDPKEWIAKGCSQCESEKKGCANHAVVTQEEYDKISVGKSRRSDASLDSDMVAYNAKENEILARVMAKLNEGFQSLGIHLSPGQWFGPGQAAQAWLEGRAITSEELRECTSKIVLEHARESYFGGWFEIMAHGIIPGITWEYDINSAYPHIISTLPCLEHGSWEHNGTTDSAYSLVYARVQGSDQYIGTMLHRDDKGNISRPSRTEGWYWEHELTAAVQAGLIDSTPEIEDRWSYIPCDCPPPLREVRDIYAQRKKVGKTTPLGIACKLVPNSLYGKFAQSIGNPKYSNPIYASLITAGCRTMILNAIATHPDKTKAVLMVATDGVYFNSRHPNLTISGELGEWEEGKKINLTLFKPGVYWDDKARALIAAGEAPVFKARGVSARDFGKVLSIIDADFASIAKTQVIPAFNSQMRIQKEEYFIYGTPITLTPWPLIEFPVEFAMVTALQALQRNDWSLAGTLIESPSVKQSSDPGKKRTNPYWDSSILRTHPMLNEPYRASEPYDKRFGIDDPFNPFTDENKELYGMTPDGLPIQSLREALGM